MGCWKGNLASCSGPCLICCTEHRKCLPNTNIHRPEAECPHKGVAPERRELGRPPFGDGPPSSAPRVEGLWASAQALLWQKTSAQADERRKLKMQHMRDMSGASVLTRAPSTRFVRFSVFQDETMRRG